VTNVADPGSAEAISFEDFRLDVFDRRPYHRPRVKDAAGKLTTYAPAERLWTNVTGICLHQTACHMGENLPRYDTIGSHYAVTRAGRVLWMADCNRIVYHGNGWNNRTVGIEVDGLYAGVEGDLRTVWDDPTTPHREQPMTTSPLAMERTRQLVRWICEHVRRNGGQVRFLVAHRQSSKSRRNDPGEAIWKAVALPLHAELGLSDGGVGFEVGGYPIPAAWDPRCKGVPY
jgi:hypothetical protein